MGDLGARAFLQAEGFELSVAGQFLFDPRDEGSEPATSMVGAAVFGELAYDLFRSEVLRLGPSMGAGWVHSSSCVSGEPAPSRADEPRFRQVLANPGEESCLSSNAILVRPGIVVGLAVPISAESNGDAGFVNLRPTYSFVARQSDYSATGSAPFSGPTVPHPAFGFSVEVGMTFGTGARATGI